MEEQSRGGGRGGGRGGRGGRGRGGGRTTVLKSETQATMPSTAAPAAAEAPVRKFVPKVVARRPKKEVKSEPEESNEHLEKLIQQSQEAAASKRAKVQADTKAPTQVAFGFGSGASSTSRYSTKRLGFGASGGGGGGPSGASGSSSDRKPSVKRESGDPMIVDEDIPMNYEEESELRPIRLPLNPPHQDADMTPAKETGLETTGKDTKFIFVQLPNVLPIDLGQGTTMTSLKDLPPGLMGKLRLYDNGEYKLKLGEVEFDVTAGVRRTFAQQVVAINSEEKTCSFMGDIDSTIVVVPDTTHLLGIEYDDDVPENH